MHNVENPYLVHDCMLPWCMPNRVVAYHARRPSFLFQSNRVGLFLTAAQSAGHVVDSDTWFQALRTRNALNASALDHLLAYPEIIPESWKAVRVHFPETRYLGPTKLVYIRYLYWANQWNWNEHWVGYGFGPQDQAAMLIPS